MSIPECPEPYSVGCTCSRGMVAIRVWVLDLTVKYDQVKKEEKASGSSGKAPKKHPTGGAGRLVGTGKKAK